MRKLLLTALFFLNFFFVFPCGWDWDTMEMEKQMFPSVHELITGKFLRHSQEFYYWRIKDREQKLKTYPDSLDLYDDLAWAYNKVHNPEKGVEIMLQKESIFPGLYKTYANLGTCYIHAGNFEEGLVYVKKAIEINPEAHFGREVYQQYLVEYVLEKMDKEGKFPIPVGSSNANFYHYLNENHFKKAIRNGSSLKKELSKAIKGVAGMMNFSNHNSPVLLEALGDLLNNADSGIDFGAGHLASRAYLKAALMSNVEKSKALYKKKAKEARERSFSIAPSFIETEEDGNKRVKEGAQMQPHFAHHAVKVEDLEAILKLEIQAAEVWMEDIRKNEILWIKEGLNPDSMYAATYYVDPKADEVTKYYARKHVDEIDEEYWLRHQIASPKGIIDAGFKEELSDSIKNWLDSVYKEEALSISVDDSKKITEELENIESSNGSDDSNRWLYVAIITALITALALIIVKKANGSGK